jgi:hypothetical protein
MSSKSIQDILGWVALTRAVNAVKDGVPNPLPPWLLTVNGEDKVTGNSVKFNRTYGSREAARVIKYGAAPRHREMQQEELVEVKFMHLGEERIFDPLVLATLRDYERYDNADKARRIVANNVKTLGTMFGNARIVAVTTSLAKGSIYVDANGNILPTSSGVSETYSHQISSNNIGTILHADGTSIFGATGQGSWANNSTDIPKQLRLLQESAAMSHGYIPRIALYGKNVPSYLTQNDYVLDYLARNPTMQTEWLRDNTIPDGLFGLTWVPVWTLSYTKNIEGTLTKTSLWPADGVTFIPGQEDREAWYSLFEGSYEVPTSLNLVGDAMAALNSLRTVYGAFGYAQVTHKPVAMSMVLGDTFYPAIKLPDTVYIADVVT